MNYLHRVEAAIVEKIYEQGGVWCKITTLKTNVDITIYRYGFTAYENLARDKFAVIESGVTKLEEASLQDVAKYIIIRNKSK